MLFQSQVYTKASGSVGGLTYAHNRGGLYTRARRTPVNSRTAAQTTVRAAVVTLSTAFPNLTASARAAWDVFAANVSVAGKLGDPIKLSGINWYLKCNAVRAAFPSVGAVVNAAPTIYELAALSAPTVAITTATNATVLPNPLDSWVSPTSNACLVFASRPQSPGTNFFNGPYRFVTKVAGTALANVTLPFPCASGNKVFFRFVLSMADGRPSGSIYASATF